MCHGSCGMVSLDTPLTRYPSSGPHVFRQQPGRAAHGSPHQPGHRDHAAPDQPIVLIGAPAAFDPGHRVPPLLLDRRQPVPASLVPAVAVQASRRPRGELVRRARLHRQRRPSPGHLPSSGRGAVHCEHKPGRASRAGSTACIHPDARSRCITAECPRDGFGFLTRSHWNSGLPQFTAHLSFQAVCPVLKLSTRGSSFVARG